MPSPEDLRLPSPTGPFPVGLTALWLTDTSRPDPWAPGVSARELMVSLWYPAQPSDGPPAPYLTRPESELLLTGAGITQIPPGALSTVQTSAISDAPPIDGERRRPLVVLSPGFTNPRSVLTGLAEDLASHGYVVAGIDHTYESRATAFPDGRVTTGLALAAPRAGRWEKVTAGRAADVSFVLDELTGTPPPSPAAGLIDPSRIAMAGHSIGGASAIAALLADPRLQAGLNMDGTTATPIPSPGLSRPFLFLGKAANYTPQPPGQPRGIPGSDATIAARRRWKMTYAGAASWERDWKAMHGWKRWLVVDGAVHASFTDLGHFADQAGLDIGATLPGARGLDITRAYVRAFADQHLRASPRPLLDQPSPGYPEVTFCSPQV